MQDSNTATTFDGTYLSEYPFTDLYVRLDDPAVPSRYRQDITRVPRESYKIGNYELPGLYDDHIQEIRERIEATGQEEGSITYQSQRLRFEAMTSEGEHWAAMRAMPLDVPEFDTLGHHPEFVRKMKSLAKKKGLIIVGGKTGDGKTTTCVSLLKSFLDRYGGMLFTIEDPPEYALQGALSEKAFCLQYEIKDNDDWLNAGKKAMRSRPDYILFGEIRTPEAAEALLKAATSGHLVIATIHAGQVSDTIAGLMQLAEHKLGKVARENLGDRLLAAVHQTLTADGPEIQCVIPAAESTESAAKTISDTIKNGSLDAIANSVKKYVPAKLARPRAAA